MSRTSLRAEPGGIAALVALAVLSLSTFVYVTAENMPIGMLTVMAPSLHTSYSKLGLLVTGYGIVVAVTSVPLARLSLRWPRRQVLCVVFAVFSLSTFAGALAPDYAALFGARIVTALSHAVFWAVVATTATSLFPAARRGLVIALLFTGSSLGIVLGVPASTWLALHTSWRSAFAIVGFLGVGILVLLVAVLPTTRREDEANTVGARPDRTRYRVVLSATAAGVCAIFVAQTYITPFLTKASGFASSSLGPTLFVSGLAGVFGVAGASWLVERRPTLTIAASLLLATAVMLAIYPLARHAPAVVTLVAFRGVAISGLATAAQTRILVVAPGSTDIASAANSSMFNVGIAGGALVGSGVVATAGVRATASAGGVLGLLACAIFLGGTVFANRRENRPGGIAPAGDAPPWQTTLGTPNAEVDRQAPTTQ